MREAIEVDRLLNQFVVPENETRHALESVKQQHECHRRKDKEDGQCHEHLPTDHLHLPEEEGQYNASQAAGVEYGLQPRVVATDHVVVVLAKIPNVRHGKSEEVIKAELFWMMTEVVYPVTARS